MKYCGTDNQVIYSQNLEFPFREPIFSLLKNCRNTRAIHRQVTRFYRGDGHPEALGPEGGQPEFIVAEDELRAVRSAVKRLVHTHHIRPTDIVILTPLSLERSFLRKESEAMKKIVLAMVVLMVMATVADAEVYKWTDDKGTVNFTDDPATIPERFRENFQEKWEPPAEKVQRPRQGIGQKDRDLQEKKAKNERALYYCNRRIELNNAWITASDRCNAQRSDRRGSLALEIEACAQAKRAKEQLESFEENSRREGALPGWLRCQFD